MAGSSEIRLFVATAPLGTAQATPVTVSLAMPPRVVNHIRVRIPPGHNGTTGFAIGSAGNPIFPSNAGQFIIGSDEVMDWDLEGQINSGAWEIRMYNTGKFDHAFYLQFDVTLPDLPGVNTGVVAPPVSVTSPVAPVAPLPPVLTVPAPPELT